MREPEAKGILSDLISIRDVVSEDFSKGVLELPWNITRQAPLLGEDNENVYIREVGISRKDFDILKNKRLI